MPKAASLYSVSLNVTCEYAAVKNLSGGFTTSDAPVRAVLCCPEASRRYGVRLYTADVKFTGKVRSHSMIASPPIFCVRIGVPITTLAVDALVTSVKIHDAEPLTPSAHPK